MNFWLLGAVQLEKALQALVDAINRDGSSSLKKGAELIRDDWKHGVDEDEGDLERSIKLEQGETQISIGIDPKEDDRGRLRIYAWIEEFGSESRPANPAGRRAFEKNSDKAMKLAGDDLWKKISQTAAREARKGPR